MTNPNLKDNLYWQLFRVAISAKHNLMAIAEKQGLTAMQLYTLCLLDDVTSIPMNSLSSTLLCDASNVTGIVDRLLHQDLIKREENPKDRREKMITLTKKGAVICDKIAKIFLSLEPDPLNSLSGKEKEQLQIILSKVLLSSTATDK
jgi:DNA-binding MarR family transcriptional regulator